LRRVVRSFQRDVGTQGRSTDDCLADVEVVEQADHLTTEDLHRVEARVVGLLALAMAQEVKKDHPVAAIGEGIGEVVVVFARQQQAVQQHDRSLRGPCFPAALFVAELETVVVESRHVAEPRLRP
jgi:hypothetical protein